MEAKLLATLRYASTIHTQTDPHCKFPWYIYQSCVRKGSKV